MHFISGRHYYLPLFVNSTLGLVKENQRLVQVPSSSCFCTHACPCCDEIWQLSHALATRMYRFKLFSRKEGKPQMMISDLQRKMENIIFKCPICFINCKGICAFRKEIL